MSSPATQSGFSWRGNSCMLGALPGRSSLQANLSSFQPSRMVPSAARNALRLVHRSLSTDLFSLRIFQKDDTLAVERPCARDAARKAQGLMSGRA